MKHDEKKLSELIKNKNFKTFWHSLDYLIMAGYSPMKAFDVSLKVFGESRIYSDVAFIRYQSDIERQDYNVINMNRISVITVGLFDDENIHLSSLFRLYQMQIISSNMLNKYDEIEETCEKITIKKLPNLIINYLSELSEKHFGFECFKFAPVKTLTNHLDEARIRMLMEPQSPIATLDIEQARARMIRDSQLPITQLNLDDMSKSLISQLQKEINKNI